MSWFKSMLERRSSGETRSEKILTADEAVDRLSLDLTELLARLEGQSRGDLQITLQLLPLGSRLALDAVGAVRLESQNPTEGRYRLKVLPFCIDVVNAAALRVTSATEEGQQDSRTDDELAAALHGQSAEVRISPTRSPSELTAPTPDSCDLSSAEGQESGVDADTSASDARWEFDTSTRHVAYEVTLGPAAIRALRNLVERSDRKMLADALRTELFDGPNTDNEVKLKRFSNEVGLTDPDMPDGTVYSATPLSTGGYIAIHRPMTEEELNRVARQQDRPVEAYGFYVVDILPADSAFSRSRVV